MSNTIRDLLIILTLLLIIGAAIGFTIAALTPANSSHRALALIIGAITAVGIAGIAALIASRPR